MEKTVAVLRDKFHYLSSHLSFAPVVKYLKEKQTKQINILNENLKPSIEEIFSIPELVLPIIDLSVLSKHKELIECMMKMVFSDTDPGNDFYAILPPFSTSSIYSSLQYKKTFSTETPCSQFTKRDSDLLQLHLKVAYQLILNKFYGLSFLQNNTIFHEITDNITGLTKFFEFELIPGFTEVKLIGQLPDLDTAYLSKLFRQFKNDSILQRELPLHLFSFEGIMMIKARDVTTRECTNIIKNILLAMPYFGDLKSFEKVQEQVRNLTGVPGVSICLTSVMNENSEKLESVISCQDKLLSEPINFIWGKSTVGMQLKEVFEERPYLVITDFSDSLLSQYSFLQFSVDIKMESLVIFSLKSGKELIGIFSILFNTSDRISQHQINNIEPVINLLVVALSNQSEKIDDEIDRVIKEQFTAVQSSVNWKFTRAARNFIRQKNSGNDNKIENIVFENVFPLYGSIDVRNSSIERSTAIQKDLYYQLELADAIIRKSRREIYLFSLQEISYRIKKYLDLASVLLFPGDEMTIQNFLDEEISELFNHLKVSVPAIRNDIENYFLLLNTNTRKISTQCIAFEESIAMINNELVKFITQEQIKIQQEYSHYFEYFVTDGVDFNIYIGQSITPDKPFDFFYLKNLKLWQLTTLVKAAQKIRKLKDDIPVPLDTTQLILAHNKPLSISFKTAERKFDVDGAYNIHYEIIKKRIDKIKIMGSCERLTQPGKVAIVFAHDKEAVEYKAYIEYLQKEGLLEGTIECYDLEELPGVRGLRALRVSINMLDEEEVCPSIIPNYHMHMAGLKLSV